MAIEVPQNTEIYKGRKKGKEKESVLISVEEKRLGRAQTLKKESEEELFNEMLTPTLPQYGSK